MVGLRQIWVQETQTKRHLKRIYSLLVLFQRNQFSGEKLFLLKKSKKQKTEYELNCLTEINQDSHD